jgi:hypothetical protein
VTLDKRNKRALVILAAALALIVVLRFTVADDEAPQVVAAPDSVPAAEKRLAKARQVAATLPAREQVLKNLSAELAKREQGMIQADTPAQAQAQLQQIARRMAAAQSPPLEIRLAELGQVRPLGADYGEASVPLIFDCRIEQLLNFLADITAQPELLATSELRIQSANSKEKVLNVRMTLSGVTPRKLVPVKRGLGLL